MITLSFDDIEAGCPSRNEYGNYFEGFLVNEIEEFNFLHRNGEISRAYRIYWEKDGIGKAFDCLLGSIAYKRTVVPNISRVMEMKSESRRA